jgi:hypothetical protein
MYQSTKKIIHLYVLLIESSQHYQPQISVAEHSKPPFSKFMNCICMLKLYVKTWRKIKQLIN